MRQQGELIRSVYPKLILEGAVTYSDSGQIQPLSTSFLKRPPLARAVHLTLGVAILGRSVYNHYLRSLFSRVNS